MFLKTHVRYYYPLSLDDFDWCLDPRLSEFSKIGVDKFINGGVGVCHQRTAIPCYIQRSCSSSTATFPMVTFIPASLFLLASFDDF